MAFFLELMVCYAGFAVLGIVLVRGVYTKLFLVYPFVYSQLACACMTSIFAYAILAFDRPFYKPCYWVIEYVTMFAACGNLWEVIRQVFSASPRSVRFAAVLKWTLLAAVAVLAAACLGLLIRGADFAAFGSLERNFRAVQAVLLCALAGGIFYFGLRPGRNMTGVVIGYGIFIGSSLITQAIESQFPSPGLSAWDIFQPLGYLVSVSFYLVCLWTYAPPNVPELVSLAGQAAHASRI